MSGAGAGACTLAHAVARVLLIGDTILNRTYRLRPSLGVGHDLVPFTYLNEELLELEEPEGTAPTEPERSIQGIGYIARYLAQARPGSEITAWTGLGTTAESVYVRGELAGRCAEATSSFDVDGPLPRVVTRLLRNVVAGRHFAGTSAYRPDLRFDTPPRGSASERLRELMSSGKGAALAGADLCLVRATNTEFLVPGWGGDPSLRSRDLEALAHHTVELQKWLRAQKIRAVLDLRLLPPALEIVDPDTILVTTAGRLLDHWRLRDGAPEIARDLEQLVVRVFFLLWPLRSLVCFAGKATLVCTHGDAPGEARLVRIPVALPPSPDGCGMVTGGDAFVAALIEGLLAGEAPVPAACRAAAALQLAHGSPLGAPIRPGEVAAAAATLAPGAPRSELDPSRRTVVDRLQELRDGKRKIATVPGLVSVEGGALAQALERLDRALAGNPGEAIVLFGESRAGKEYSLRLLLERRGAKIVATVNTYEFLAKPLGVLRALNEAPDGVLLLDEVPAHEGGRPLLNLMAERTYHDYSDHTSPLHLTFKGRRIILLTSIPEDAMLDDLRGRIDHRITIPPLSDRRDEIPYLLRDLCGKAIEGKELAVSHRMLQVLCDHDYRPRRGADPGTGLDQRNFRALSDVLRFALSRAPAPRDPSRVELTAACLPDALQPLVISSVPDDRFVRYPATYKLGDYPLVD